MNEKKFHKLIESELTTEELKQKEKTLEKIYSEIDVQPKEKSKSKPFFRLMPIASAAVLMCIMIPISILLINRNLHNSVEGNLTNDLTGSNKDSYQNDMASVEAVISTDNTFSHSNGSESSSMVGVLGDIATDFAGTIDIKNNIKYFISDDAKYNKEITAGVEIFDKTGKPLGLEDLTQGAAVTATIVIEVLASASPFKVGDIKKLTVG